jgi:hypothetical protein
MGTGLGEVMHSLISIITSGGIDRTEASAIAHLPLPA